MVLVGANGTLSRIASVDMWGHQLVRNLVFFEHRFHVVGAFIVQNVYVRGFPVRLEHIIDMQPCCTQVRGVATFYWYPMDSVGIIVIRHKDVFVSPGGCDGEFSRLV